MLDSHKSANSRPIAAEDAAKRIEAYNAFAARAEALDLPAMVDAAPLLNVSMICGQRLLRTSFISPGP